MNVDRLTPLAYKGRAFVSHRIRKLNSRPRTISPGYNLQSCVSFCVNQSLFRRLQTWPPRSVDVSLVRMKEVAMSTCERAY